MLTLSVTACGPSARESDAREPEPTPSQVRDSRFEGTPVDTEEQWRICDSAGAELFKEIDVAQPSEFLPGGKGCVLDDWQHGDMYAELTIEFTSLEKGMSAELLQLYGKGASECLIYPANENSFEEYSANLIRSSAGDFCVESRLTPTSVVESGRFTLRATRVEVSVHVRLWDSFDAEPLPPEFAILVRDFLVTAVRAQMMEK